MPARPPGKNMSIPLPTGSGGSNSQDENASSLGDDVHKPNTKKQKTVRFREPETDELQIDTSFETLIDIEPIKLNDVQTAVDNCHTVKPLPDQYTYITVKQNHLTFDKLSSKFKLIDDEIMAYRDWLINVHHMAPQCLQYQPKHTGSARKKPPNLFMMKGIRVAIYPREPHGIHTV